MNSIIIDKYIDVSLGKINAVVFSMTVEDLLPIYYVAIRGKDEVEGAVQRVLNKRRVTSIRDFILEGNSFFNLFILNWVDENYSVKIEGGKLIIPQVSAGAQVLDGQHRLEGFKQAYETDKSVGKKRIIVLMTQHLSTPEAASIFLNINTEQKPVPASLVFDLFGEVKDKKYYIVRATDIANKMHEDPDSPYYQCIKKPGAPRGGGKVDLSTVVNALKQFTKDQGVFSEYKLKDFESQYKVILNFFSVIRWYYDAEGGWLKTSNPFMTNAGCYAGIDFMCRELLPKCVEKKSFEVNTLKGFLPLDGDGLLYKEDLKNKQGKEQRAEVYKYLKNAFLKDVPEQDEYKF